MIGDLTCNFNIYVGSILNIITFLIFQKLSLIGFYIFY